MSNTSDESKSIGSVLSKLSSLSDRQKSRTSSTQNIARVAPPPVQRSVPEKVEVVETYQEPEVVTEVIAQRVKGDEEYNSAKKIAEEMIPARPIRLRANTEFTPENMYEQVKADYVGFIQQSINDSLDAMAVFYMQNKRFAEAKDLRFFLIKNIQQGVASLKEQYVAKYPLISGLPQMIAQVEKNEAQLFRNISNDFINRMISSTFGN
jgi:hypothetical protein